MPSEINYRKATVGKVVVFYFVIPSVDRGGDTSVTSSQVLAVWAAGVLENAAGSVGSSIGSEIIIPGERRGPMQSAIFVVRVERGLSVGIQTT